MQVTAYKRLMKSYLINLVNIRFGGIIILSLILTSCVSTREDILRLNDQIININTDIKSMQQSMQEKTNADIASIRKNQAEMGAEIYQIREEMRALNGLVEESQLLIKSNIPDIAPLEKNVSDQAGQLVNLQGRIAQLQQQLGLKQDDIVGQNLAEKVWDRKNQQIALLPSERSQKGKKSDVKIYTKILSIYKGQRYDEAIKGFNAFIKKYPKSELIDNAQFWIGESLLNQKKYEQAILAFQEVIKKYPKGNKVPNSMLSQSAAFKQIKDIISAKLLLKKIIKQYPNSDEAGIARVKLKNLK